MKKLIGGLLIATTMLAPIAPAMAQASGSNVQIAQRGDRGQRGGDGFRGQRGGNQVRVERQRSPDSPRSPNVQRTAQPQGSQPRVNRQWQPQNRGDAPRWSGQRNDGQRNDGQRNNGQRNWNGNTRQGVVTPQQSNRYQGNRQIDGRYQQNRNGNVDRRAAPGTDRAPQNYRNNRDYNNRNNNRNYDNRNYNNRNYDNRNYNNRNYNNRSSNWNRSWRDDRRYDWRNYRQRYGNNYRLPTYYSPYRNYGYTRFSIGFNLMPLFYSQRYWVNDPSYYRLPPAYDGYRWVRYYNDVLLVDTYNGRVVDVIHDFFW